MKKFFVLTAVLVLMTSNSAFAAIALSAHDFSALDFVSDTQICQPCHVPHNADATAGPLWNHDPSAVAVWTPYDGTQPGSNLDSAPGAPTGVSLLCLGCHDNSTAVDAFGGAVVGVDGGIISVNFPNATVGVGGILNTDHPVSFLYDTALATADGQLVNPVDVDGSGLGGNLILFGGNMECGSCHDVHNGPVAALNASLLLEPLANSAICTSCHVK